jgi:signal transduction histidine kinase
MRTSTPTRISLAIGFAVLVTLAVSGYEQFQREKRDLRTVAERELRVLGTMVEIAVANALRDAQLADVHETLDSLHRIDPSLRIGITDPRGVPLVGRRAGPALPRDETLDAADEWRDLLPGAIAEGMAQQRAVLRALGPDGRDALLLVQPLRADESTEPFGALVLTRSLRDLGRDLRMTQLAWLASLLVAGLAILSIGRVAGRHFVTAPLASLGAAMREVRDGDGAVRVTARHSDDVGALVSEFNAMVAAVSDARARLEREIEARHALERGLQHVDKLVTVGQLASGLAHEIGSPLQVLHGRATTLRDASHEPEEVRRQAAILVTQTERIIRIVQQLLSFGRRLPLAIAPHDLRSIVAPMVEFIEPTARRRGVEVTFEHDDALPLMAVDADRLQQVTLNLLTNALRATERGGWVRVSLRREPPDTSAAQSVEPSPARVQLAVADSGCGIAPDVQPRLFEPFFTTAASEGGAGLGLAVARSIVHEHGGEITVESEPGRGSRFTVSLPIVESSHPMPLVAR